MGDHLWQFIISVLAPCYLVPPRIDTFFDTCCFNNLHYMVLLLGVKGQLHMWIFTCNFFTLPVLLCYSVYANARSRVRVGEGYSEDFEVKVGVHQGSVLSPLLFIIVLEALSWEFRSGVPWEDLYADDLVIIAESLEECVRRLLTWKEAMEKKGLRVNAGKTKIMICGTGLDLLQSSGEFPCAVCCTGVGSNSIFCNGCKHWVHKKCSWLKRLIKDPDYRCTQCQGTARPLVGRPQKEAQVGPDKLEVVASFCYLGDMLSAAGGCELSTTTRVKTAWKKFKDLLSVLSSRHLSFKTCGRVYSSCVRSAMLHASETWPLTKPNLQCLQRNDRAMIRQICNVSPQGIVTTRSNELLVRLGIEGLDLILKERWLRWCGHVERSNGAVKTAFDIQVDGKRGPKMTWKQLTERDCREWKLSAINPHDRRTWRSGVRSTMRVANQIIWKGAHWCGCCPCTCTLIKNPIMIMIYDLSPDNRDNKIFFFFNSRYCMYIKILAIYSFFGCFNMLIM